MNGQLTLRQSALLTDLAMCVNYYRLFSPGLFCCVHAPVQLNEDSVEYPGVCAFVNYGCHKQADPDDEYRIVNGSPNFVLDVFLPDEHAEYERRLQIYAASAVTEYVAIWDSDPLRWNWHRRQGDSFPTVDFDEPAIYSTALPGLWVPVNALRQRDWWTIMATIARGVTRREHHDLMDSIWNAEADSANPSATSEEC